MAQGGEIYFSMEKAKKLIDFEPLYSLEDTVKNTKDWIDKGGLNKSKTDTIEKYGDGVNK